MDPRHQLMPEDASPDDRRPNDDAPDKPRSRRAVLSAAVAAAGGALAARTFGVTDPVDAANGATVRVGRSHSGTAVTQIRNTAASSRAIAVKGLVTRAGIGVQGIASATSGNTIGVAGFTESPEGRGVQGTNAGTNGTGIRGVADDGADAKGVLGRSVNGIGVHGEGRLGVHGVGAQTGVRGDGPAASFTTYGVYGRSLSSAGFGVYGTSPQVGVSGDGATGLFGSGTNAGVIGLSSNYGVQGISGIGYAGYFRGRTHVEGTLTKTGGSFLIDHPQDPANKTLEHSFVEAPERLNVYSGTVTLDANGRATVRLPRYFGALNTDVRYQLTPIGRTTSVLYIAREVSRAGSFRIGGGGAGQRVCWQVTGVRRDAWAREHPLRVVRTKRRRDRGSYLNPEAFGKPRSAAMHPSPGIKERRPRRRNGPAA